MKDVRGDFPILENNPKLVYLDSACTSLKPNRVIEAQMSYYKEFGACGGRSSHRLGRKTSEKVEEARETVAQFVGARREELVWTRNATEALNIVAQGLDYSKKRKVVTTMMEHHSVLLPFMRLAEKDRIDLEILPCDSEGKIGIERWSEAIDNKTALVATHSWNNTLGTGQDVEKIAKIAHDNGAQICIDGAQGVPHHRCGFKNIDFLCFSGHKMLGPTGIGALVMKNMKTLEPLMAGGGTVKTVHLEKIHGLENHERFEAGIQHYSGIIGFSAACDYLKKIGMEEVERHERTLGIAMEKALLSGGAFIHGPKNLGEHGALYSFNLKNAKAHDVALMLDKEDIACRSGFFCAQPAMDAIGAKEGAVRASAYIYNTSEDIKRFADALQKIRHLYD